jgi:hypothetical protein
MEKFFWAFLLEMFDKPQGTWDFQSRLLVNISFTTCDLNGPNNLNAAIF